MILDIRAVQIMKVATDGEVVEPYEQKWELQVLIDNSLSGIPEWKTLVPIYVQDDQDGNRKEITKERYMELVDTYNFLQGYE